MKMDITRIYKLKHNGSYTLQDKIKGWFRIHVIDFSSIHQFWGKYYCPSLWWFFHFGYLLSSFVLYCITFRKNLICHLLILFATNLVFVQSYILRSIIYDTIFGGRHRWNKKNRNRQIILRHNNTNSHWEHQHQAVDFITSKIIELLTHYPYTLALSPYDFFFVPTHWK